MAREEVSGVGKGAKRTDLGNVAKIQRSARIENATGGTYGQRAELRSIASQEATGPTGSAVSAQTAPLMPKIATTDIFTPSQGTLTDGAGMNTPGTPPNTVNQGLTSPDSGHALAAALFTVYPNPYTKMLLESYSDEVMY